MLAALLAVLLTAATADAAPLDGCVDTSLYTGVTSLACDGDRLAVLFSEGDIPASEHAAATRTLVDTQTGQLGLTIAPEPVPLEAGGRRMQALSLVPAAGAPDPRPALFVSAASGPDHLRAVFCVALDGDANLAARCGPILGELLANGVASLKVASASTVTIGGRRIDVPAGCAVRLDGNKTDMRCAGGAVYSAVTYPDPSTRASAPAVLQASEKRTRSDIAANATFEDPACTVLGGPGLCRTARADVNGVATEALFGVGVVGGVPVTVYCLAPGMPMRATGCSTLVSW